MILIDTNICIYMMKGISQVREQSKNYRAADMYISSISVAELLFGAAKSINPDSTRAKMYDYINRFNILDFSAKDALAYGNIRAYLTKRGEIIGPIDMLIAAQAIANDCKLITNNVRKFQRVPNLVFENWMI
ncbi:MAG: PIN domain-containing protein [Deferribacteraceae bacterium]|jgi:tRNA(fMet)-specific endonuclease VapC|nr:PIN domain-containing protein [Deferribacteraceae bacterium]